jgi:phosphate transport system substrate-binding protein
MLGGCSETKTNADRLVVRGSNTYGEELSPRLIQEFQKDHPGAVFDTEFKGTSYGFGALTTGNCDIAAASREVTTNEVALTKDSGVEFQDTVIGSYGVAVVVNAANSVADLSLDQVRDIFSGAIQNWKDVGGPDAPIHLYIRSPISGTYLGFQEVAMEKKPYAGGAKPLTNHVDIVQAVAKDPHGIGYSSLDLLKKGGVKGVSVGGIAPTVDSVNKRQYPYARVLRLYTSKGKETPIVSEFLKFVQSQRGQQVLSEMGYVPKS